MVTRQEMGTEYGTEYIYPAWERKEPVPHCYAYSAVVKFSSVCSAAPRSGRRQPAELLADEGT